MNYKNFKKIILEFRESLDYLDFLNNFPLNRDYSLLKDYLIENNINFHNDDLFLEMLGEFILLEDEKHLYKEVPIEDNSFNSGGIEVITGEGIGICSGSDFEKNLLPLINEICKK